MQRSIVATPLHPIFGSSPLRSSRSLLCQCTARSGTRKRTVSEWCAASPTGRQWRSHDDSGRARRASPETGTPSGTPACKLLNGKEWRRERETNLSSCKTPIQLLKSKPNPAYRGTCINPWSPVRSSPMQRLQASVSADFGTFGTRRKLLVPSSGDLFMRIGLPLITEPLASTCNLPELRSGSLQLLSLFVRGPSER
jgi:hypothetical protein